MEAQCYVCGAVINIRMSQSRRVMCSLCEDVQSNETAIPNDELI